MFSVSVYLNINHLSITKIWDEGFLYLKNNQEYKLM